MTNIVTFGVHGVRKQHFCCCKRGEGGNQRGMVGFIMRGNVYNYGRPIILKNVLQSIGLFYAKRYARPSFFWYGNYFLDDFFLKKKLIFFFFFF